MDVDPGFWADRRVLVTGHTGFKGSWLSLWLAAMGAEVTGVADSVPTRPSLYQVGGVGEEVRPVWADIRDAEAVGRAVVGARPEIVVHLAAQSLVRRSLRAPRATYEINVIGTANVLDAVRAADGVRAVVNVTSDKCYENRSWAWGYREDDRLGGEDPYSSSKGCAELLTSAYRSSFFSGPDAPRLASARAGNAIGGGDWAADRLIPDVMRAALDGRAVTVRSPRATRPWQHVLNPLAGYLVLAQALWDDRDAATAWNFGPADEDAQTVAGIVDRLDAMWPGGLRWELATGPHPGEPRSLKLDSSRARDLLGWTPGWDLNRALEKIVDWYCALRGGADMRSVTLAQLAAYQDDTAPVGQPGAS